MDNSPCTSEGQIFAKPKHEPKHGNDLYLDPNNPQFVTKEITLPNQSELTMRVLKATAFRHCEDIFWRTDDKYAPITFIVHCSDVFDWGCSDGEIVTPENIHILEQSLQEADNYGAALFCARVRKKRPMDTFFENIPSFNIRAMFYACGPERETNITNPKV